MIHRLALAPLLCVAFAAAAQDAAPQSTTPPVPAQPAPTPALAPSPPVAPAPRPATIRVSLQTTEGAIVLELEKARAPITTANFLRYLDAKRLDGIAFYRAVRVQPGYGLIQAGVRDPKKFYPPIAHEPTSRTGLSHKDGTISMARGAPGSAAADFFITIGDLVSMDADPKQPGDNLGFAAFGHVVEGMDVVRHILDEPTSATAGPEVMKGQMLVSPVRIVSARRAD